MIKEITVGEETLEIELDGAPLWKIWILHIVLFVRFGKLLKKSISHPSQQLNNAKPQPNTK